MTTFATLKIGGTVATTRGNTTSQIVKHEIKSTDVIALPQVAGDKVTVISIPANTKVEVDLILIEDASVTGTTRIDVGDSSSDTLYVNNASTLTSGTALTIATASKVYTAADSIFIKYTTGTLTGTSVIRVVMRITDLSRDTKAVPKVYTNV